MKQKIIDHVKQVLLESLKLPASDEINLNTRLKEDLGLDSMSSLTFLMALEDAIDGFTVNPETLDVNDLITVESISNYIHKESCLEQPL